VGLLDAIVQVGKLGMIVYQFVLKRLNIFWRQTQRWRGLINLDDLKFVDIHLFPAFLQQESIPQKVTL
jgi:hypothetical protein